MSILKALSRTPTHFLVEEESREVHAFIHYSNQVYYGVAKCHPEDKDFFSEKVGKTIALSRARINALSSIIEDLTKELNIKIQTYREIQGYGSKSTAEIDPTGAFIRNIMRTERRLYHLQRTLKKMELNFNEYLKDQKKAISTVKKMRAANSNE